MALTKRKGDYFVMCILPTWFGSRPCYCTPNLGLFKETHVYRVTLLTMLFISNMLVMSTWTWPGQIEGRFKYKIYTFYFQHLPWKKKNHIHLKIDLILIAYWVIECLVHLVKYIITRVLLVSFNFCYVAIEKFTFT